MVIFQSYVNVYQRVVVTMEYDGDHDGSLKPMKRFGLQPAILVARQKRRVW